MDARGVEARRSRGFSRADARSSGEPHIYLVYKDDSAVRFVSLRDRLSDDAVDCRWRNIDSTMTGLTIVS